MSCLFEVATMSGQRGSPGEATEHPSVQPLSVVISRPFARCCAKTADALQ